jgi:reverse gyrase
MLILYSKALKGLVEPPSNLSKYLEDLKKAKNRVIEEIQQLLSGREYIVIENYGVIVKTPSGVYLVKPDPYTYVQASGRITN